MDKHPTTDNGAQHPTENQPPANPEVKSGVVLPLKVSHLRGCESIQSRRIGLDNSVL